MSFVQWRVEVAPLNVDRTSVVNVDAVQCRIAFVTGFDADVVLNDFHYWSVFAV